MSARRRRTPRSLHGRKNADDADASPKARTQCPSAVSARRRRTPRSLHGRKNADDADASPKARTHCPSAMSARRRRTPRSFYGQRDTSALRTVVLAGWKGWIPWRNDLKQGAWQSIPSHKKGNNHFSKLQFRKQQRPGAPLRRLGVFPHPVSKIVTFCRNRGLPPRFGRG